jgi:hypothetical protein
LWIHTIDASRKANRDHRIEKQQQQDDCSHCLTMSAEQDKARGDVTDDITKKKKAVDDGHDDDDHDDDDDDDDDSAGDSLSSNAANADDDDEDINADENDVAVWKQRFEKQVRQIALLVLMVLFDDFFFFFFFSTSASVRNGWQLQLPFSR